MKSFLFLIVVLLFLSWTVQASKTLDTIPYTERAGGVVSVHKVRFEWHPERYVPFLKKLPEKIAPLFHQEWRPPVHRRRAVEAKLESVSGEALRPIRLKNGTEIRGRIVEENDRMVWIEVEGGRLGFRREELAAKTE